MMELRGIDPHHQRLANISLPQLPHHPFLTCLTSTKY